jgi:MFS family permease
MTALSGLAWGFASLFVFRLAVGVGEASCAPAANSLLGDLFPAQQRGRAIAVFMLGLPLGLGLSYVVSGLIAHSLGWRAALFVAGVPGLLLGGLALGLPEPARGGAETHSEIEEQSTALPEAGQREIAILAVLRIPTMRWIIVSGALLNLNMYALGAFLTSLLMRYHGLDVAEANRLNGAIYGFGGGLGMLGGGWLCDRVVKRRVSGRLELAALAMALAVPCLWLALNAPRGQPFVFAAWLLPGCLGLYFYYSAAYATIQDVVEPRMRGTAMAVYFFVFYVFTAIGLFAFGWLSDHLARAALAGDVSSAEARALGLHGAMQAVPVLTFLLVGVLWAGSRSVAADHAQRERRANHGPA